MDQPEKAPDSGPSTRDRIVAAAFQLFLQHGFDGTGLSQILSTSGTSKGAFYHYFETKEALYREVVESFLLKPMRAFDFERLAHEPLRDSRDLLDTAYEQLPDAVAAAGIDMARYFGLFFEAMSRLDDVRTDVRAYYDQLLETLSQRIYDEREVAPKVADTQARNIIAQLEGRMFLTAVFGKDSAD